MLNHSEPMIHASAYSEPIKEVSLEHEHHSFSWNQRVVMRGVLLTAATAALLSLTGCGLSPTDQAAASVGFGGTISEKTLNNIARPPIQVVYRFDDHRYIENDPGPGYNLPCQAELFYVDEKLGIRTQAGGNSEHNPEGLFKVVNSPYVVTRSDVSVRVSFDQGRTFKIIPNVPGSTAVVVVGDNIYMDGGGARGPRGAFNSGPIELHVIKPDEQKIELQYTAREPLSSYDMQRLAAAGFPVPKPDPRYAELKKLAREHVVNNKYPDPTQYFTCRRDLQWRPSINRERQLQKAQQQSPSTVNASPNP
ncbi:T6SS immunity protein Tli3 family protein [Ralstonia pseudosolanacearum]|uniref:T6SS immunity protein Tli3 family protein n=1 Tax=Ralstonia pseudosolanacearum TaxID=1310165 RepID=UPI003CF25F6C